MIIAFALLLPQTLLADLYAVSSDTSSVLRYSDQGDFISEFVASGAGGLVAPSGLAFGPDGNLYVSDNASSQILRYSADGTFIDVFASDPQLNGPNDLVFRGDDLFVSLWNNAGNMGGVARVNATTGVVEDTFGTGSGRRMHAIAFGDDGNLYASSFDLARIRVFDPGTGDFVRDVGSFSTVGRPMGLTFNQDGNLIVNNWFGDVRLIDAGNGSVLSTLVTGLDNTQWNVFAPDGTLIIDSWGDQSLARYDVNGNFIESFADLGFTPDKYIFHPIPGPPTAAALMLLTVVSVRVRRR